MPDAVDMGAERVRARAALARQQQAVQRVDRRGTHHVARLADAADAGGIVVDVEAHVAQFARQAYAGGGQGVIRAIAAGDNHVGPFASHPVGQRGGRGVRAQEQRWDRADTIAVALLFQPVRSLSDVVAGRDARPAAGFSTEVFCQSMADFVRRRKSDRPFFAWLALTSPHDPRTPPAEFRARYDPAALPLPANFRDAPAFDNGELAVRDELLAPRPLTAAVLREHLADYYGMISHHDAWLGHVQAALRERGQEANTIVV